MTLHRCKHLALAAILITTSCSAPPPPEYGDGAGLVSIAYLKSLCSSYVVTITGDIDIEGVVVSSDICGEFYKSLVIEDATGGIEVRVDRENLFAHFKHGSKVRVRCNSLVIGMYGGSPQLGARIEGNSSSVGRIADPEIDLRIKTITEATERPFPHILDFRLLTPRYINCLVRFEDVGFTKDEVGKRFCEAGQDTNRHLVNAAGDTLIARVNQYFRFATNKIPSGRGTVEGILGYFNDSYQIKIYDIRDIDFE